MKSKRQYKSGTNWCLWRWTFVPSNYIIRLHLVKTPWFAICLHWLNKPDEEPYLHDHPVSFVSFVLRGWYKEKRCRFDKESIDHFIKTNKWINVIKASQSDRHRVVEVAPNTLTLCIMGPKTREWGFYIEERWLYWKDYYRIKTSLGIK